MNTQHEYIDDSGCRSKGASPLWCGVGSFFVAPIAAIFCVLMGAMMILAWPFIPFLCYMQKKEELYKAKERATGHQDPTPI